MTTRFRVEQTKVLRKSPAPCNSDEEDQEYRSQTFQISLFDSPAQTEVCGYFRLYAYRYMAFNRAQGERDKSKIAYVRHPAQQRASKFGRHNRFEIWSRAPRVMQNPPDFFRSTSADDGEARWHLRPEQLQLPGMKSLFQVIGPVMYQCQISDCPKLEIGKEPQLGPDETKSGERSRP